MHPKLLIREKTYQYTNGIQLKYWYEQLNYWSFTTVAEPHTIVLLHSQQIKDLTEL